MSVDDMQMQAHLPTTKQTWRYNNVVPGVLLALLPIGIATLGVHTVMYHVTARAGWTATWVGAVYLAVLLVTMVPLLALLRRPTVPDCRPLYGSIAVLATVVLVLSELGRAYPREMTIGAQKMQYAALWLADPSLARWLNKIDHIKVQDCLLPSARERGSAPEPPASQTDL